MSGKVIQPPGVSRATLHMHLKIDARIYKDIHTHLERPMHVVGPPNPTAIKGFGRKLGHIGGHMGITGRESGSPDGAFLWKK